MPNIPVYNPDIPQLDVKDTGVSAWDQAAHRIASYGAEQGRYEQEAARSVATGLEKFGGFLQQQADFADTMNFGRAESALANKHTQEIQDLLANQDIPPDQKQLALTSLQHQQLGESNALQGQFGRSSNSVQEKIQARTLDYQNRLATKYEAYGSGMAASAILQSYDETLGNLAGALGTHPTTMDIDAGIQAIQDKQKALLSNPSLSPEAQIKLQNEFRGHLSSYVQLGVRRVIDYDASRSDDLLNKYGGYLMPGHQEALITHAHGRAEDAEASRAAADVLGRSVPTDTSPIPQPGQPPQTGSTAIKSAIYGQEGSGPNSVSINGARGRAQIIEPTFNQYKREGENFSNEQDRMAVSGRAIDDYVAKYGGDPSRVAVAYFSGPGNVAPPDSPTPWKTDAKDGNGVSTSTYVRGVLGRLGNAASPVDTSTNQPVKNFDVAVGDSIAAQQIRHGVTGTEAPFKSEGLGPEGATARIGDTPQMVLQRMQGMGADAFRGKAVFLSPGTSNDPSQLDAIEKQADFLKQSGASAVVIPGVGPNVVNRDDVNARLGQIAQSHGFTFFQPDIQWQSDGIHPAEVDKLRQQGLSALNQQAPDTLVKSGQAPTPPVALTAGGPTPQPTPAPTVESLGQAQGILAQQHAAALAQLAQRQFSSPDVYEKAVKKVDLDYRAKELGITGQMKALTEQRNVTTDKYLQEIMNGSVAGNTIDPKILSRIANDPALDATTRDSLWKILEAHQKATAAGESTKFGSDFHEAVRRLLLDDDNKDKIRDPSQIIQMAVPKGDGTVGLTVSGVNELTKMLHDKHENSYEPNLIKAGLDYARNKLAFEAQFEGGIKIADPEGQLRFDAGFTPAFFKFVKEQKAKGMSMTDIVSKENLDNLIAPYDRPETDKVNGLVNNTKQAIQGQTPKPDLTTQDGVMRAYKSGQIGRNDAAAALNKLGVPHAIQQPQVPIAQ